jgi:hypothetical protein
LSNTDVAFRNDVVHRGKIPTRRQAIDYGDRILMLVRSLMRLVKKQFHMGVDRLTFEHLQSARNKVGRESAVATLSTGTILSLTRELADEPSLEQEIHTLPRWQIN